MTRKWYALLAVGLLASCDQAINEPGTQPSAPAEATKSALDFGCWAAESNPAFWVVENIISGEKQNIKPGQIAGDSVGAACVDFVQNTAAGASLLTLADPYSLTCACKYVCGNGSGDSDNGQCGNPQTVYDPPAGGTEHVCTVGGVAMHCCPPGSAMIGARLDNNVFKCAPLSAPSGAPFLDSGAHPTVRFNMHTCPFGSVMVGLQATLNDLACQAVGGSTIVSERVDSSTADSWPMHVCENIGRITQAMSGIRADQNLLTCASSANFQE